MGVPRFLARMSKKGDIGVPDIVVGRRCPPAHTRTLAKKENMPARALELIAGIGGNSLALRAVGVRTVAYCEKGSFLC